NVLDFLIPNDLPACEFGHEIARCWRMVIALLRRKVLIDDEAARTNRAAYVGEPLVRRWRVDQCDEIPSVDTEVESSDVRVHHVCLQSGVLRGLARLAEAFVGNIDSGDLPTVCGQVERVSPLPSRDVARCAWRDHRHRRS